LLVNGVEPRKRKRSPSMTATTVAPESHREKRGSGNKSKETLEQIQFREFVGKVERVLLEYNTFGIKLTVVMILRLVCCGFLYRRRSRSRRQIPSELN
jgi:hypothetical protein